jgi:hypothetical protein
MPSAHKVGPRVSVCGPQPCTVLYAGNVYKYICIEGGGEDREGTEVVVLDFPRDQLSAVTAR